MERDEKGFILTGSQAGADGLLETSVTRVYAAVVRFVHEHLEPAAVKPRS